MLNLICATILLLLVADATDAHRRHDFDDVMRHPHYHHGGHHAQGHRQMIALHDGRSRGRDDQPVSWYHRARESDYDRRQSSVHGHGSLDERLQHGGCPRMCLMNYNPVCGTDSITYSNDCELRVAACTRRMRIDILKQGPC
ncbi:hypothetical protein CHS0354_006202 [Potamilus streckersoni]|uniref:Kazal-like domain-containing protein n=1 Tax=Potamilus streckersoni TaxID=2493646 RepID=A0AAE0SRD9_9BIVA|nr:hypothetical protein CHS0354_006202 [Potamilus streckersoni]